MARNIYFSESLRSEQNLYEDIVIESLKIYGQNVFYLPRDIVNEDTILGEDIPSRFNSSYMLEMYIENAEGFDGEGDLFTKFGVEIRDEATFVVSRRRWSAAVKQMDAEVTSVRPLEGDLIYLPMTKKLFQITMVEHEQPFYQLQNLPVFKLRCTLFEYNDEDLDTGVTDIDKIEKDYGYTYILTLNRNSNYIEPGHKATMILDSATSLTMTGEVTQFSDSDDKLHLVHVGASDGTYRNFLTNRTITISGGSTPRLVADSDFTVSAITEENSISENEQNDLFSSGSSFLDFSENNPFGDTENQ
jgi:hypothetical protein